MTDLATLWRKKPDVVEAVQVVEPFDYDQALEVVGWARRNGAEIEIPLESDEALFWIRTPEWDRQRVAAGYWVTKNEAGEFRAYRPETFAATYDPCGSTTHE